MSDKRRVTLPKAPWLAVLLIFLLGILAFLIYHHYSNRPRPLSQASDLVSTEFAFARIEYGESDGTGTYQEVSIPVTDFQRILSDVSAVPGRSTTAMPENFSTMLFSLGLLCALVCPPASAPKFLPTPSQKRACPGGGTGTGSQIFLSKNL